MGDSNTNTTINSAATEQETDDFINNMTNRELFCLYAVDLLTKKGVTDLDNPEGEDMIVDLVERIEAFISQELFFALPEDKILEMADEDSNIEELPLDEIMQKFNDAGVDVDLVVKNSLDKFSELYLSAGEDA
jgi:hypothetical protein